MIRIKKIICKYFGHNFEVYPSDRDRFEMAGYCKRCGYDTHDWGEDEMKLDKVANSGNDEFYTPEYAITPLLKYIPSGSKIWCPFDTSDSLFV